MKNGFVYKRATLRNPVLGTRENNGRHLCFRLHVGINRLDIVKFFQTLNHLVDALALFCSDVLKVIRNVGEFSTNYFVTVFFQMALYLSEAFRIAIDGDATFFLIFVIFVFHPIIMSVSAGALKVKTHLWSKR